MAQTFDNRGLIIEHANSGTVTIDSGDVVDFSNFVGVALADIAASESGSVGIEGILTSAAAPNDEAWAVGDLLYHDGTNFTVSASGNTPAGYALAVKATATTTGTVYVVPGAS